jgi:Domain of unknown function (DUF4252)
MKTLTSFTLKSRYNSALTSALVAACLLVLGVPGVFAQSAKLQLSQLDKLASKASEVTNVDLEGPMLKLAAQQMSQKAETPLNQITRNSSKKIAAANLVRRLKGIYVKTFEFAQPGEYTKADLDSVMNQLQSGGWKAVVHVEEKKTGETTGIYVMEEGGEAVGIAIVAAEPKELTVVNLVGPIDFSQLGGLGSLGALGSLGGLAGSMGNANPQLQHRSATTLKGKDSSK